MKKFDALLTKWKGKTAMDEWEMMIFRALYSVPKNSSILFPYLLVNLFKQIYISSAKSDKYLNKS